MAKYYPGKGRDRVSVNGIVISRNGVEYPRMHPTLERLCEKGILSKKQEAGANKAKGKPKVDPNTGKPAEDLNEGLDGLDKLAEELGLSDEDKDSTEATEPAPDVNKSEEDQSGGDKSDRPSYTYDELVNMHHNTLRKIASDMKVDYTTKPATSRAILSKLGKYGEDS